MSGNFLGLTRTGQNANYGIIEIWAYNWVPFDETNSLLSSDVLPNATLVYSVHLVSSTPNGITANTLFSTGPGVNCYWMM